MGECRRLDPETLPPAWIEMTRHPDFARAARRLASNMLHLCETDRRLAAVFKDAGRYVAAMSAAYLHGMGGLTLPLLKQICAGSGFLSPGRAHAILEFLQHIDYLQVRAGEPGGKQYLPTKRFLSAWQHHLQAALDAAAVIEPALASLVDRLSEPSEFEAFLAIQTKRLHKLTREADPFPELNRAFLHPHAGSQILWMLVTPGNIGIFPDDGEIKVSLSDLSNRFDVAHLHVRRLLRQAQQQGLLLYHGHGRLCFEPLGISMIRYHFAFQLSELVEIGKELLGQQAVVAESQVAAV